MTKVRGVGKIYSYRGLTALRSLAEAIRLAKPDLIVPGDDLAACHLHQLYKRESLRGGAKSEICKLIESSLGAAENFSVVSSRTAFIDTARAAGIRAPRAAAIPDLATLKQWVARTGFPTVLKADGTSGGDGVRVVHNLEDTMQAWRTLQAPPLLLRAFKRAAVDGDTTLLWPALLRRSANVSAQKFVAGREATSAVACWQGEVLASLHFEVLNKRDAAGPSSVLRLIENRDMSTTAEVMVQKLKLSGFHGFDFMLEAETGNAHLIEINPRATQVGHLALGPGRDLPAAMYTALTKTEAQPSPCITTNDTIALFPQEWTRDPRSSFLQSAYHDVPWDEPELLKGFPVTPQSTGPATPATVPMRGLTAARAQDVPLR